MLAGIVTQHHSLCVCVCVCCHLFFSAHPSGRMFGVKTKPDSGARMNGPPDVRGKLQQTLPKRPVLTPDNSLEQPEEMIVCFECFDVKKAK